MLQDDSKFTKISNDPSNALKTRINKLISRIGNKDECPLPKLSRHFEPGYIYGNPKTHKNVTNPPLRPNVSQIGTVTYTAAKLINTIITPYMPKKFMIGSTFEFIMISKTIKKPKLLASLDVESLFTNVTVLETIEIILNNVYNNDENHPLIFL